MYDTIILLRMAKVECTKVNKLQKNDRCLIKQHGVHLEVGTWDSLPARQVYQITSETPASPHVKATVSDLQQPR